MAKATASLTPKQRRVYDLLDEGKTIPEIAKKLNISPSGVYGHMRNIRAAGVTLPTEQLGSNGAGPDEAPTLHITDTAPASGPEASLRAALAGVQDRLAELDAERGELSAQCEKYSAALAALA